ncbi:hypothetical protein QL285_016046 [Trifolium repens]|nr:hypothetical protein QL285_016045 [Trifolium repens]KAK2445074.1 hypothetical protein QL285_016046 [Trifolium repens]
MLTMDGSGFHKEGQHLAADWQHLAVCWQHSARGRQQAPAGLSKLPQDTAGSRRFSQVLLSSSPGRVPHARASRDRAETNFCDFWVNSPLLHATHTF